MENVYNAYGINTNSSAGLIISDELKTKLEAAIITTLIENKDECIAYSWTLNDSYKEDCEQVIICYPDEYFGRKSRRIEDMFSFNSLNIRKCLFTDCEDVDEVKKLCQKVALGEIEPVDRGA